MGTTMADHLRKIIVILLVMFCITPVWQTIAAEAQREASQQQDGIEERDNISKSDRYDNAFNISEVDQIPQFIKDITLAYTVLAKRNNIQGRVVLRFIIDTEGNVVEPQVTESEPEGVFDKIALEAVLKARFKPAIKDGKAVNCIVNLPITFKIR
jgi:TonB family protein